MKQEVIYVNSIRRKKKNLIFKRIRFVLIICSLIFFGMQLKSLIGKSKGITVQIPTEKSIIKEGSVKESFAYKEGSINYEKLETEIRDYIKEYQGQYGIYYCNINTGDEFGINDEDEYTAASTIKIPLNLCLYERIKSGSVNPDGTMTYIKEDYEEGTGNLQYEKFGSQYSIRELSKLSITMSDNVAANILIRLLGNYTLKDYMRQVGGKVVDDDQNASSPRDMGLYMKLIYDFYKSEGEMGKELMENFLNTEFNDRLPAMLPKTVKVAHKIGSQINVVNDVGIVFTDNPYIISVMSKNVKEDEAPIVIANISKKVYDFVTKQP